MNKISNLILWSIYFYRESDIIKLRFGERVSPSKIKEIPFETSINEVFVFLGENMVKLENEINADIDVLVDLKKEIMSIIKKINNPEQ